MLPANIHFRPLLCRYAMSFAANDLKFMYVKRTPESNKTIHVVSSAYKAIFTWNNMQILQVSIEIMVMFDKLFVIDPTKILFMHKPGMS